MAASILGTHLPFLPEAPFFRAPRALLAEVFLLLHSAQEERRISVRVRAQEARGMGGLLPSSRGASEVRRGLELLAERTDLGYT